LNQECEKAMRVTIPAVRIAVAKVLNKEHKMSGTEIGKKLGITQAAVSKYLSGDYSPKIVKLVSFVEKKKLHLGIVDLIVKNESEEKITNVLDKEASNKVLVSLAL
jgi:predicted transcriptional regulator